MRRNSAKDVALGGVLAALALVIMCLGTLIPAATFVCPMLCCLVLHGFFKMTTSRMAWAWYGAVAILSVLLAPDKEAAATFVFLGYYPIVKPKMDKMVLSWLWKALLFNVVIGIMYLLLIHMFGMAQLASEIRELGLILGVVMLVLGNATFFMLDVVLGRKLLGRKHG